MTQPKIEDCLIRNSVGSLSEENEQDTNQPKSSADLQNVTRFSDCNTHYPDSNQKVETGASWSKTVMHVDFMDSIPNNMKVISA